MNENWDYIVVGAGSSGCVVAEKLSADPRNRVLVLEAGGESGFWNRVPKGVAKLVTNPDRIWAYPVAQPREVAQLVATRRHVRDRRFRIVIEGAELVVLGLAEQRCEFPHHVRTWRVAHRDHGDARCAPGPHLLSPHTCSHVLMPVCSIHRHA